VNIFDGHATRAASSRPGRRSSRPGCHERQILAVDVEVRRAVSACRQAVELAEASQKVVAQAEEALRLATAATTPAPPPSSMCSLRRSI